MSVDFSASHSLSILSLPSDVLQHHIFIAVDRPSILSCCLTCTSFRNTISRMEFQYRNWLVLREIFRGGYVRLLLWFQDVLKYPKLWKLKPVPIEGQIMFQVDNTDHFAELAAEGCIIFQVCFAFICFLIFVLISLLFCWFYYCCFGCSFFFDACMISVVLTVSQSNRRSFRDSESRV